MVLVRDSYATTMIPGFLDASEPWTIFPGRVAGAKIHGFVKGGILVLSVYLIAGEAPESASNWQILLRVAEILNACGPPYVIGGDFQCDAATLVATGWTESIGGEVAQTGLHTCTTSKGSSEIDYFVMSPAIRAVCSTPTLFLDSLIATHTPVQSYYTGNPRNATIDTIQTPKEFPRHQLYGPERKPAPWPPFRNDAEGDSMSRMNALSRYWVTNSEIELCNRYDLLDDKGNPSQEYLGRASKPTVQASIPRTH